MSHAILSPSGASRWLNCTPSARLEQNFPDTSGEAAKEGTLAHSLGEAILRYHYGMMSSIDFGKIMRSIEAVKYYNADMEGYARDYAAYVIYCFEEAKMITKDAVLQIEQSLNLTDYVPEGFGTGDSVIIADGILDIIDLKYGKGVRVSCENNKQMMLYGLGALREFDFMYDIRTVRLTIYQPRIDNISSWEISVEDLKAWAENELMPKAKLAFEGKGEFAVGDHCRFCKAKAQCKALAEENLKLAKYDFESVELLSDEEISDVLTRADAFTQWIKAVEEFAFTQALAGKKWPGFKLVEGRSNRVYTDQNLVAGALLKNGYKEDMIYTKSLLGITAMEKAITKKTFEALLSGLIIKPQGKPTLVPEADKRSEWNSAESAVTDFTN